MTEHLWPSEFVSLLVPPLGVVLCACFPVIFKQRADQVDLNSRHQHHDDEIYHRPEVHPVIVVLLQVSVASLERSQQRLDLQTFAQSTLHVVDGVLNETRQRVRLLWDERESFPCTVFFCATLKQVVQ